MLWVGGEPWKTAIITGTVPLKAHYKGVESVWGRASSSTLAMPS